MSAMRLYEATAAEWSDLGEHRQRLHDLAVGIDAQTVIELGVRSGVSTLALLAAVEKTGGRVWSCDIDPAAIDLTAEITGHPRWTLHIGDDLAAAPIAPQSCDLLFIDTTHEGEHTRSELALYGVKVSPGGLIVMHDADPAPGQDVIGPALDFARVMVRTLTYFPGSYGLAVIR